MTAAAHIQLAVLIHHRVITRDLGTGRALTINGGAAVIVHGGFITVNLRAGATVADGVVTVVIDNRLVAVDLNTDGIRIGDGHAAFVVHRRAVAGDINTVTAAAHIQLAVLVHHRIITRDFSSGGAFAVDDGFSSVVYCGIITRNNELTVVIILPLRCTICAYPFKSNRVMRFINLPKINSRLTPIAILQRNSPVSILGISKN